MKPTKKSWFLYGALYGPAGLKPECSIFFSFHVGEADVRRLEAVAQIKRGGQPR